MIVKQFLLSVLFALVLNAERPPNVVIIFIDDMGYGDIGPFGAARSTPHLDRMAAEGMKLTDFYVSSSACTPSRAALMTGCYADRIGMGKSVVFPADKRGLNPSEITIAELLKKAGYATGCFGKWHLGDQLEFMPLAQGFDEFEGIPYSNDMWVKGNPKRNYPPLPWIKDDQPVAHIPDEPSQAVITDAITDAAVDFIKRNRKRPFFAYIPHAAVHAPHLVTPKRLAATKGDVMTALITEIDNSTGRILQTLSDLGIDQNTLVFFTNDNGGAGKTSPGPLRGAKFGPKYEGHMRVATLAWWPGKIPAGSVSSEIMTTTDLFPTIAKLAGLKVPSDRIIDGKNIGDILLGKSGAKSPHQTLFYEKDGIRQGKWKLVHYRKRPDWVTELYDLEADLGEKNDLAKQFPDRVEAMKAALDAHVAKLDASLRPAAFVEDPKPLLADATGLPTLAQYRGVKYQPAKIVVAQTQTNPKPRPTPNRSKRFHVTPVAYQPAPNDILIAAFEDDDYGSWKILGEAMGKRPSRANTHRNRATGYIGKGFVNTYLGGDKKTGELVSPPFKIRRKHINFLIGGGSHPGRVGMQLRVGDKTVRSATGHSLKNPKNEEIMDWQSFDVSEFVGREAVLRVIDQHSGGWGHTVIDHIFQSDRAMPSSIRAADEATPQPPTPIKPSEYVSPKTAQYVPPSKPGITLKDEWSTFPLYDQVGYDQSLRPQFHFTSRMGWLNDPNGMVYYDGEWHMLFQHFAKGNASGAKSWGNAVSTDLMHWQQLPHAINPYAKIDGSDGVHAIWSGSAVVDELNALGKQKGDTKALFALYSATHDKFFQGGAYSTDRGRTWAKINDGRPVIPHQEGFSKGQRDPRSFYYAPGRCYFTIMMIGGPDRLVRLWKSTNLLDWEHAFDIPNKAAECIDMFHVAVDGDPNSRKWVIADAPGRYEVGEFNGKKWQGFGTEDKNGDRLRFEYGDAWYAAQAFNQAPDGRTVHVGWLRSKQAGYRPFLEAGMPFTQQMSVPVEITLRTTPAGIRMFRNPVNEIEKLYTKTRKLSNLTAKQALGKFSDFKRELLDLTLRCEATHFTLNVRGLKIRYERDDQEFVFENSARVAGEKTAWNRKGRYRDNGIRRIPAPPIDGKVTVRVLVDRASLELFVNDGQAAASFVVVPDPKNRDIFIKDNLPLKIDELVVNELRSIW